MSSFEILFGRQRHLAGIPYVPLRMAADAESFFERQAELDWKLATIMNSIYEKQVEQSIAANESWHHSR